jgi:DNA-binding GntR family transcriptional regulator
MATTPLLMPRQPRGPAASNVDIAATALREAIVKGRLGPGRRITEMAVAEELGISRGPIREAIRLLEHDGLLKIEPNKGAVVPEVRTDDVLEVYAMRAALGSLALHKFMLDSSGDAISRLDRELQRLRRGAEAGKAAQVIEADLKYQSTIVAMSAMSRVIREFERLTWQVRIFITSLEIRFEDRLPAMVEEIEALHLAICSGDTVLAERVWREKLELWVRDFTGQLKGDFNRDLWLTLTIGPDLGASMTD